MAAKSELSLALSKITKFLQIIKNRPPQTVEQRKNRQQQNNHENTKENIRREEPRLVLTFKSTHDEKITGLDGVGLTISAIGAQDDKRGPGREIASTKSGSWARQENPGRALI